MLRIEGDLCRGRSIAYTAPAGSSIEFGQRDFLADIEQITFIQAGDLTEGDTANDPSYFDTHDVLLSLRLVEGPTYEPGSGTFTLLQGGLWACGAGTFVLESESDVNIDFTQLTDSDVQGTIQLEVVAFTEEFGAMQADACSGTVTIHLTGPWSRFGF